MSEPIKILAFAGSLRKESFNKKLVKIAMQGAKLAGAHVTYIDLKDYPLPIYDQDEEDAHGLPENVLKLKDLLLSHQGFLIASPEYNSSSSAVFKNMIDWTTRKTQPDETYLCCFIDKAIALMSASPGELGGLRGLAAVRVLFNNIYSLVLPKQKCIPLAHLAFDDSENLKEVKQQEEVMSLGKELTQFLTKHQK